MTESDSPFLLPKEVDAISRLPDLTRWRLERQGRFPKRIKLGVRKIAWRRSDIEAWARDPEAWGQRQAAGVR